MFNIFKNAAISTSGDAPIPVLLTPENRSAVTELMFDRATRQPRPALDPGAIKAFLQNHPSDVYANLPELSPIRFPDGNALIGLWQHGAINDASGKFAIHRKKDGTFTGETATTAPVALLLAGKTAETSAMLIFSPKDKTIMPHDIGHRFSGFTYLQDDTVAARRFDALTALIKKFGTHLAEGNTGNSCDCEGHRSLRNFRITTDGGPLF